MRDWNSRADRQTAKEIFWKELIKPENYDIRNDCISSSKHARQKFAELGEFYLEENKPQDADPNLASIPKDVEFRVFPEEVEARENMVLLVLRSPDAQHEAEDPDRVWMCTYFPY